MLTAEFAEIRKVRLYFLASLRLPLPEAATRRQVSAVKEIKTENK